MRRHSSQLSRGVHTRAALEIHLISRCQYLKFAKPPGAIPARLSLASADTPTVRTLSVTTVNGGALTFIKTFHQQLIHKLKHDI